MAEQKRPEDEAEMKPESKAEIVEQPDDDAEMLPTTPFDPDRPGNNDPHSNR